MLRTKKKNSSRNANKEKILQNVLPGMSLKEQETLKLVSRLKKQQSHSAEKKPAATKKRASSKKRGDLTPLFDIHNPNIFPVPKVIRIPKIATSLSPFAPNDDSSMNVSFCYEPNARPGKRRKIVIAKSKIPLSGMPVTSRYYRDPDEEDDDDEEDSQFLGNPAIESKYVALKGENDEDGVGIVASLRDSKNKEVDSKNHGANNEGGTNASPPDQSDDLRVDGKPPSKARRVTMSTNHTNPRAFFSPFQSTSSSEDDDDKAVVSAKQRAENPRGQAAIVKGFRTTSVPASLPAKPGTLEPKNAKPVEDLEPDMDDEFSAMFDFAPKRTVAVASKARCSRHAVAPFASQVSKKVVKAVNGKRCGEPVSFNADPNTSDVDIHEASRTSSHRGESLASRFAKEVAIRVNGKRYKKKISLSSNGEEASVNPNEDPLSPHFISSVAIVVNGERNDETISLDKVW
jgi:hypothetical protein